MYAGQAALGAYSAYSGYKDQQAQVADARKRARKLAEVTPSEREYIKKQREIIERGDPNLQSKFNRAIGGIRQQGQFARQRQMGGLIGQGLEDSIIASDIRRKTDTATMKSIAEQSQMLAEQNRVAKERAEADLLKTEMGIEERQRRAESGIHSDPSRSSMYAGVLGSIAQAGMAYMAPQMELEQFAAKKEIESGYEWGLDTDTHMGGSSGTRYHVPQQAVYNPDTGSVTGYKPKKPVYDPNTGEIISYG